MAYANWGSTAFRNGVRLLGHEDMVRWARATTLRIFMPFNSLASEALRVHDSRIALCRRG